MFSLRFGSNGKRKKPNYLNMFGTDVIYDAYKIVDMRNRTTQAYDLQLEIINQF
jgi:hypothetical protein